MTLQDLYLRYEGVVRPLLRLAPVVGGGAVLAWRMRETRVPVTPKSILIPPIGMSTGFFMFLSPLTRVPWPWAIGAFLCGLLGVRLLLHDYVGHLISPVQTAAVFYLLAFGMIVRWRADMYRQYRRLAPAP